MIMTLVLTGISGEYRYEENYGEAAAPSRHESDEVRSGHGNAAYAPCLVCCGASLGRLGAPRMAISGRDFVDRIHSPPPSLEFMFD
jgi:hypothetical protein